MTLGTLKYYAKEDNPDKYIKSLKSNDTIKSAFTMLEKDITEHVINNLLKKTFINTHSKPEQEFYFFNNNIWECDEENQNNLKIVYEDLIKEYEALVIVTSNEDEKEIKRN